jgi:hypothetical protein
MKIKTDVNSGYHDIHFQVKNIKPVTNYAFDRHAARRKVSLARINTIPSLLSMISLNKGG